MSIVRRVKKTKIKQINKNSIIPENDVIVNDTPGDITLCRDVQFGEDRTVAKGEIISHRILANKLAYEIGSTPENTNIFITKFINVILEILEAGYSVKLNNLLTIKLNNIDACVQKINKGLMWNINIVDKNQINEIYYNVPSYTRATSTTSSYLKYMLKGQIKPDEIKHRPKHAPKFDKKFWEKYDK